MFDSGAASDQGFQRWREESLIAGLFELGAPVGPFRSRYTRLGLGAGALIDYQLSPMRYSRSTGKTRRDGVDHVWVQLVGSGAVTAAGGGRDVVLSEASAGFCDLGLPVEQSSGLIAGRAVLLPRAAFRHEPLDGLHGAVLAGGRYKLVSDYFEWLLGALPDAALDARMRAEAAIAAVLAACFSRPDTAPSDAAVEVLRPLALRRAEAFIAAQAASTELTSAAIASAAGVSRATLYRLFAARGGVEAHLWAVRLEAARRALSDPNRLGRIGEIAAAHGFTTAQHFSRRFRDRYGFSPRNLRPF